MKPKYNVTVEKDNKTFATLCIRYYASQNKLLLGVNNIIKKALKEAFIAEEDVSKIKVFRKEDKVKIEVEYRKNEIAPKAKIKYQRKTIMMVLKKLGYAKEEIKSLSYEDEKWNIEICEFFELDEYDSVEYYIERITSEIKKELNIDVNVTIS